MGDHYKLIYFDCRSRAEPIRMLFALAGVHFEDFRLNEEEWTPEKKNSFPWGQLPILEINGEKTVAQSTAICRYLARKFGFTGIDDFEAAKCDELVDTMMELRTEWRSFWWADDEGAKATYKRILIEQSFPRYFSKFEKFVDESTGDFLLGKNFTWADIHIAHTLQFFRDTVAENCLENYPNLRKFIINVFNIPKIKEWIQRRPESNM